MKLGHREVSYLEIKAEESEGRKGRLMVPKSASLSSPLSLMSRFWGLRSRCSTFCLWQ